jgi:hypothetical protein
MALAELQRAVRDALVDGHAGPAEAAILPAFRSRLAIHRRNYEASLVRAVLGRFPATEWLVGTAPLYDAAVAYVHAAPPEVPCIAEYGGTFPAFLDVWPALAHLPFLADFARLDFALGHISVAADPGDPAASVVIVSDWPVDRLMARFLDPSMADDAPLESEPVRFEVRGVRGEFTFSRLSPEPSHVPVVRPA